MHHIFFKGGRFTPTGRFAPTYPTPQMDSDVYFVYLVNSVVKYRTSTVKQKATYEECLKLDDSANDNLDLASLRLLIWT